MIGWSRGAVTCLRMAYQMHEIFPAVGVPLPEVNIFAIDPVAGLGNKGEAQNSTIPPCVDNYLATLAVHEQRKGFEPQSIKRVDVLDPKQSNVVFLPFPGRHDTQVRREGGTTGAAASLVWHLAYKFLAYMGTRIRPEHIPVVPRSVLQVVEQYSLLRFNMPDYRELRQHAHWYNPLKDIDQRVQGGLGQRDFAKNRMDQYVFEAGYFINEHHRTAFKRCLPNTYFHLFGPKSLITPKSLLQAEGIKIRGEPATLKTLEGFGYDGKTSFGAAGAGRTRGSLEELEVRGNLVRMGLFA
jgi:hypothetical protein